jgi:uncharacterized membrane protein YdjX (TVP38/TMEM64 family)
LTLCSVSAGGAGATRSLTGILKYKGDYMKKNDKPTKKLIIVMAVFFSLMIALSLISLPFINFLSELEIQTFKAWVSSLGVGGRLLVLSIQIVQIVIAFIPGEPVEILSGMLYGGFGGLLLCLFGCVIASSCFMLSKKLKSSL